MTAAGISGNARSGPWCAGRRGPWPNQVGPRQYRRWAANDVPHHFSQPLVHSSLPEVFGLLGAAVLVEPVRKDEHEGVVSRHRHEHPFERGFV